MEKQMRTKKRRGSEDKTNRQKYGILIPYVSEADICVTQIRNILIIP